MGDGQGGRKERVRPVPALTAVVGLVVLTACGSVAGGGPGSGGLPTELVDGSRDGWVEEDIGDAARANLERLSPREPYVEPRPDAPWWEDEDAMTATIVLGASQEQVAAAMGIDLSTAVPMLLHDAPWSFEGSATQLLDTPQGTVVIERNGYASKVDPALTALSHLGRTVSLYWNVNRVSSFIVAEGGEVLRWCDPAVDGAGGTGGPLPEEADLDWDEGDPIGVAAELQSRLTGIRLTRGEVFGTPRPTVMVPSPG